MYQYRFVHSSTRGPHFFNLTSSMRAREDLTNTTDGERGAYDVANCWGSYSLSTFWTNFFHAATFLDGTKSLDEEAIL